MIRPNCKCLNMLLRNIQRFEAAYSKTCTSQVKRTQILHPFTAEEQLKILNVLQACAKTNSTRPHLSIARLQRLKELLKANPNLDSLEPLLQINGLGPSSLNRLCKDILHELSNDKLQPDDEDSEDFASYKVLKVRSPATMISPSYISQPLVRTAVSIKLNMNSLSWARLHIMEGHLDSWNRMDTSSWAEKKFDVHSIWNSIMELRKEVPDADIYVLENSNWSNVAMVKKPMKYHIQEAMLNTAICSIFNQIDSTQKPIEEIENRVYFLNSFLSYRMFQKVIGSERVSAEDIVQNMIEGVPDARYQKILFTNATTDQYLTLNGPMRDSLCQALLLIVSFAELILRNNPVALEIINRKSVAKNKILS